MLATIFGECLGRWGFRRRGRGCKICRKEPDFGKSQEIEKNKLEGRRGARGLSGQEQACMKQEGGSGAWACKDGVKEDVTAASHWVLSVCEALCHML